MNCNCQQDINTKLAEHTKEQFPTGSDHNATLQGYGFAMIGNAMTVRAFMPVMLSAMVPVRSGDPKLKTTKMSMFFSYCPFCGVKA